jgi:maltose alpha-D-glucosyltransferase/alpha-amylase
MTALRSADFRVEDLPRLSAAANGWVFWISAIFLHHYLRAAAAGEFLPATKAELKGLLDIFLLQKAVYELNYELNNRPGWVGVPLRGILEILETPD